MRFPYTKLSKKAEAKFAAVTNKLKRTKLSELTNVALTRPHSSIPAGRWGLPNRILVYLQTGEVDCRNFYQWKRAGRYVIKGSESAYILTPTKENNQLFFEAKPVFSRSDTESFNYDSWTSNSSKEITLTSLRDLSQKLNVEAWSHVDWNPLRLRDCYVVGRILNRTRVARLMFFRDLAEAVYEQISFNNPSRSISDIRKAIVIEFIMVILIELYGEDNIKTTWKSWWHIRKLAKDPTIALMLSMKLLEEILRVIFRLSTHCQRGGEVHDYYRQRRRSNRFSSRPRIQID